MATFIDSINRVMRNNAILSGDDDDLTTLTDLQHRATSLVAQQAVQSTLTDLAADRLIPVEETEDTISMVTSQRVYDLPADFVRFCGEAPFFLELDGSSNSANRTIYEYPGGRSALEREVLNYREQEGTPNYFYTPIQGSSKKVAFYQVPDSSQNGVEYRYIYEKSVYPTTATDTMPFSTDQEHHAFCDMASRRFKFLFAEQPLEGLENDVIYKSAKSALMNLMRPTYGNNRYGYDYR